VKDQGKSQPGVRDAQLEPNELFEGLGRMDVQLALPLEHVERRNQTDQAKEVIAVQMADQNPIDPAELQLATPQLNLSTLSAVD
jgi:hypothetical protein